MGELSEAHKEDKKSARKFEALIDEYGLDDGGVASFTFQVQSLKKGNIYEEYMKWNGKQGKESAYEPQGVVIDDNGCWWHVGTDNFKVRFKEVSKSLSPTN